MSNLWRYDSPFIQKMTAVTNLVILNVLWLICSLPIITMGSATSAMYSVLFAYRRKETDSVLKPFFSALKKTFVQSTICWLILLALGFVLGYDALLLIYGAENQLFLCIPVVILGFLVIVTGIYIFPQIAMFDNKLIPMVKNCFLLFFLNPIISLAVMLLALLPWILLLFFPQIFWMTLLLWTLIGFSLCASINSFLLKKIFDKYIEKAV